MSCNAIQSMGKSCMTMSTFMLHKSTNLLFLSLKGKHEQEWQTCETITWQAVWSRQAQKLNFTRTHKPSTTRFKHEQEQNSVEQQWTTMTNNWAQCGICSLFQALPREIIEFWFVTISTDSLRHRRPGTNRLRTLHSSVIGRQERAVLCLFGLLVEHD